MTHKEIEIFKKLRDELKEINPDPWENIEEWATRAEILMKQISPDNLNEFARYCHPWHPDSPSSDAHPGLIPLRRPSTYKPPNYTKDKEKIINFLNGLIEFNQINKVSKTEDTIVVSKVFIIHGHDESLKQAVARFIEKLDLEAIILHEQPDKGKTLMEKVKDYSSVGFAVVLLTPDDVGKSVSDPPEKLLSRARQNVVMELGYFIGKLGRNRVCALLKEGVEKPENYNGVLYIPVDVSGAWQLKLAKELKAAGLEIDLHKAM